MKNIDAVYARYAGGDPRCLDDLLEAGRRVALAVARRLNATDPDEVAQQAIVKAWKNIRDYDPQRASFSTWLYSITRRVVTDAHRAAPPVAEVLDDATMPAPPRIDCMRLDTTHLNDADRRVLAVFAMNPDFDSAAATLGITVAALKKRLHRIAAKNNSCESVPFDGVQNV